MFKRLPWGHESRRCARCGEVGPRVHNPNGPGYIHAYCRTDEEKRAKRQRVYAETKRQKALPAPGVPASIDHQLTVNKAAAPGVLVDRHQPFTPSPTDATGEE